MPHFFPDVMLHLTAAAIFIIACIVAVPIRLTMHAYVRSSVTKIDIKLGLFGNVISAPLIILAEYDNIKNVTVSLIKASGKRKTLYPKQKKKKKDTTLIHSLIRSYKRCLRAKELSLSGNIVISDMSNSYMLCGAVNSIFIALSCALFGENIKKLSASVSPRGKRSKLILNFTGIFSFAASNIICVVLSELVKKKVKGIPGKKLQKSQ